MQASLDVSGDVLDEIALEGLDGITIKSLYLRLQKRKNFLYIIDEYSKPCIWEIITKLKAVTFYALSEQREDLILGDDLDNIAQLVHESKLYPICPIKTGSNGVFGSCQYYVQRKDITNEARLHNYEDALKKFGQSVVLVASQIIRFKTLCGEIGSPDHRKITENTPLDYILLELVGRARERGLPTAGPGSAQAVAKDSRTIFYHCQHLLEEGLVRKHNRGNTAYIFLKRYKIEHDARSHLLKALLRQSHFTMSREEILSKVPGTYVKMLQKLAAGSEVFERVELPYSEVFPGSQSSNSKKKVMGLRLKDPEKAREMLRNEGEEEHEGDASAAADASGKRDLCLGMSLTKQVYLAILESRNNGVTCKDLYDKFECGEKPLSKCLRKLIQSNVVKEVREQVGKQKKIRATLSDSELKTSAVIERLAQLERDESKTREKAIEINIEDATADKEPVVVADVVNEAKAVLSEVAMRQESERKLWRMGLVLRAVKLRRVIARYELTKYLTVEEKKLGFKERIDRRSVNRIIEQLADDGIVQIIEIDSNTFVAEPSFEPETLKKEEVSTESLLPLMTFEDNLDEMLVTSQAAFAACIAQEDSTKVELVPFNAKKCMSPKFLRLSILHDILFYMVRGYDGDNSLGQEEMLERLKESSALPEDCYEGLPPLYKDRISSYMFIPPLPNAEKTPGWCSLIQMLMYTPLCMFLKLVRVQRASPALTTYLNHTIKCNYPLIYLPPHVRAGLLCNKNMTKVLIDTRRLCFMGLVKFGRRGLQKYKFMWSVYVNIRASILDTTTSATGCLTIEKEKEYKTISYIFHSVGDVKAYWVNLFNVCLETKLGQTRDSSEKKEMIRELQKEGLNPYLNPVTHSEALKLDTGAIPGDNLGAGGIDSAMYSFLRFNWISGKPPAEPHKKVVPKPKLTKKIRLKFKKKAKKTLASERWLDDADIDAVGKMQRLRVNWSTREDNILILCRVAIDVLCNPTQKRGTSITRADVRTALRRLIGSDAMDKTQFSVARRMALLGRGRRWVGLMNTIKQAPELQKFVAIRPDRGSDSTQSSEYLAEMKNMFHKMIDFMSERFLRQGLIIPVQTLDIPDSMEEFNKLYELAAPAEKPLTLKLIQEDSIRAVLLSSLASVVDRTSQTSQLFEVYRQYDEVLLKNALNRLHRQKIVAVQKRLDAKPKLNTSGAYQFSQRFKYLMNAKFQQSVYYEAHLELNRLLCCRTDTPTDVNLASSSPTLFALSSSSHLTLTVTVPEQFIQLDHKAMPADISKKILDSYKERQESSFMKDNDQTLDDDDDDGQPPAKRALYDTDDEIKELGTAEIEDFSGAEKSQAPSDNVNEDNLDDSLQLNLDESKAPVGAASARVALMLLREVAKNITEEHAKRHSRRPLDVFAVSSSKVQCTCSPQLSRDYGVSNVKAVRQIILEISESHKLSTQRSDDAALLESILATCSAMERQILLKVVGLLNEKKVVGATLTELHSLGSGVGACVRKLEESRLAIRLGTYVTHIVSRQYASDWAIKSFKMTRLAREKMKPSEIPMSDMVNAGALLSHLNDTQTMMDHDAQLSAASSKDEGTTPVHIIMRPWLRVDGHVNRRILDRMLGSVLGRIMTCPGSSIAMIADKFSPALTAVWIRELFDLLNRIGCITMVAAIRTRAASLFEEATVSFTDNLDGLERDDEIFVEPNLDAIVKLGQFIGNKSYSKDILVINDEGES